MAKMVDRVMGAMSSQDTIRNIAITEKQHSQTTYFPEQE